MTGRVFESAGDNLFAAGRRDSDEALPGSASAEQACWKALYLFPFSSIPSQRAASERIPLLLSSERVSRIK
jgi:hypothetical protein